MKFQAYAPAVARIGLALVFLWFGFNQLFNASMFLGYVPSFTYDWPITSERLLFINGVFEVLFGFLLLIGYYTRVSAALLGLHLLSIIMTLGYNDIAIRDIGLFFVALSVFLHGPDRWCLELRNT